MKLDEKAFRVNRTCNLVLQSLVHCIVWLITCCHISKPRIIVQGPQNVRQITATDLSGIFMKESWTFISSHISPTELPTGINKVGHLHCHFYMCQNISKVIPNFALEEAIFFNHCLRICLILWPRASLLPVGSFVSGCCWSQHVCNNRGKDVYVYSTHILYTSLQIFHTPFHILHNPHILHTNTHTRSADILVST